jgi:hypothetical protein
LDASANSGNDKSQACEAVTVRRPPMRHQRGQPLHDMWVPLTLDTRFVIQDAASAMDAYPQAACPHAVSPMRELVVVKIGAGWQAEVRQTNRRRAWMHAPARAAGADRDHCAAGDGRRAARSRAGQPRQGKGLATPGTTRPIARGFGTHFATVA